jgi:hypothetical protein
MRRAGAMFMFACLIVGLLPSCCSVETHLRSKPADRPVVQAVEAPVAHTVLAKSASSSSGSASSQANSTVSSNSSSQVPFRVSSYTPEIGKVFALYYSSMSGQKVSQIEARYYNSLSAAPSDPVAFDPDTGAALNRGNCKLRLKSHTTVMSDQRKYNLRLAEVAVCEQFFGNPCADGAAGCEIEMFAPLPYDGDQEKYIAAGMALTAHSVLCAKQKPEWQQDSCAIVRNKAAIAAGLQQSSSGIKLRPIPGALTDLKLDATHELGFAEAVFATANEADYEAGTHYANRHDPLAYSRTPPQAAFCEDLGCLITKFETR